MIHYCLIAHLSISRFLASLLQKQANNIVEVSQPTGGVYKKSKIQKYTKREMAAKIMRRKIF